MKSDNQQIVPHSYRGYAGEIVADVMALLMAVLKNRPEVAGFKSQGAVLTVDLATQRLTLGLRIGDDRAVIVETFPIDQKAVDTFGVSDLAIVVPKGAVSH